MLIKFMAAVKVDTISIRHQHALQFFSFNWKRTGGAWYFHLKYVLFVFSLNDVIPHNWIILNLLIKLPFFGNSSYFVDIYSIETNSHLMSSLQNSHFYIEYEMQKTFWNVAILSTPNFIAIRSELIPCWITANHLNTPQPKTNNEANKK